MSPAPQAVAAPSLHTGYLMLAGIALTWGANYPLLKMGLEYAPPLLFTVLRMTLGTLVMALIVYRLGRLRWPPRGDWPVVFSAGVAQNMLFITLITIGLQYVPAGRAAVLAYTSSIWVVPLAAIYLGERLTLARAIGVVLGLIGLGFIFHPAGMDWQDPNMLIGGGLIVSASLMWSIGLIHIRRHHWHSEVLDLLPWQLLVGVLVLMPIALMRESPAAITWTPGFVLLLLVSGPLASGLCVYGLIAASRALPAVSLSLMSMAVPTMSVVASMLVLGERPSLADLAGFAAIVGGIAIVSIADLRRSGAAKQEAGTPAS